MIIKTPYLCTTPQGGDGYFGRGDHEKKKGLTEVRRGNREREKEKKTSKVFWNFKKDFYLCSPNGNGGKQKKDKEGAMPSEYSGYGS